MFVANNKSQQNMLSEFILQHMGLFVASKLAESVSQQKCDSGNSVELNVNSEIFAGFFFPTLNVNVQLFEHKNPTNKTAVSFGIVTAYSLNLFTTWSQFQANDL